MKPRIRHIIVFWIWTSLNAALFAQESLEELLTDEAEENTTNVAELADAWRSDPIDLNRASRQTLESFPLISRDLAGRIIREREKAPFESYAAFIARLDLDVTVWQEMEPFFKIRVGKRGSEKRVEIRLRHESEAPKSEGFRTNQYAGSSSKVYQRIRLNPHANWTSGILLEKDPGERDWTDHRVGFVEFRTPDQQGRILAGNYRMETGQGLVFCGPYRFSQGADPLLPFAARTGGPKGYLTADESSSFFGLAAEWNVGRFGGCLIYSKSARDARLDGDRIASFPTSGLHRTDSEMATKDNAEETVWGASCRVSFPFGQIGLSGYASAWNREVAPPLEQKYGVIGAHYDLGWGGFGSSGEAALTQSGGGAFITNQFFKMEKMEGIVSLRAFSDYFNNPHGNAFCAKANSNEQGGYFGVCYNASPSSTISASFDLFRRPAPTSTFPLPSDGSVSILLFRQKLNPSNAVSILYKRKEETVMREGETPAGRSVSVMRPRLQNQLRIELVSKPASRLRLKSRVEWTEVSVAGMIGEIEVAPFRETGLLMFEDIQLRLNRTWAISGRWITFHTGSYDSRIYVYEQDVPGAFALAPLYGNGNRQYLFVSCRLRERCSLSFKYGETCHDRAENWGSGLDRIEGDLEREWTIQADMEF